MPGILFQMNIGMKSVLKVFCFIQTWHKDTLPSALDLIRRLLTLDPSERISTEDAMQHPWLQDDAMKKKVEELMKEEQKKMPRDMPPPPLPVSSSLTAHDD